MSTNNFKIGDHDVGDGGRCFIVAEVAQAHDGSLGQAHAYIDAVSRAGADAVKFQTHIAEAESSPEEPWRIHFSLQDASRYDYWKRMEFREDQWIGLKEHAERLGLVFLSSPFSERAVDLLDRIGMPAWKIASGELSNTLLLDRIARTRNPILLSTGMSSLPEIDRAVNHLRAHGNALAVLQCSSSYPTTPENLGLNLLADYRDRYQCPVGLSDHSGKIYAGLAAVTLGVDILEIHVTMTREMFGPDTIASVTTAEFAQLVEGTRFIEHARASPVDKNGFAAELTGLRDIFTKSLFAAQHLPAGTRLRREHLVAKKPGTGIRADQIDDILDRMVIVDVKLGQMLKPSDLGTELIMKRLQDK